MSALHAVTVSSANTWTAISSGMVVGVSYGVLNLGDDRIDITESAASPNASLSYRWLDPFGGCAFVTFAGTPFWVRSAAATAAVQIVEVVS